MMMMMMMMMMMSRYPSNLVCPRACTKMKISTVYLARYVNEDKQTSFVTFNFGKLIDVSVEVESYRFLNMVAEIGGKYHSQRRSNDNIE